MKKSLCKSGKEKVRKPLEKKDILKGIVVNINKI